MKNFCKGYYNEDLKIKITCVTIESRRFLVHKKMALINPPSIANYRSQIMMGDSISLATVASIFKSCGWEVAIYDCFVNEWNLNTLFAEWDVCVDFVGITVHKELIPLVIEMIREIRKINPTAYIMLGGSAPTLNPKSFENVDADCIFSGDDLGELKRIIDKPLSALKRERNNVVRKIYDSESFDYPMIYRPDLVLSYAQDHVVSLESSRGCYGRCKFCTVCYDYNSKWIPRTVKNIHNELLYIKETVPDCTQLRFIDSNFLGGRSKGKDRIKEITDILFDMGYFYRIDCRASDVNYDYFITLKQKGLCGVFFGIESGSQRILNELNKGVTVEIIEKAVNVLTELKIAFAYGFIMITPSSDINTIKDNLQFLKRIQYGIKWKHFFSALRILKDGVFEGIVAPERSYEMKNGFRCTNDLCAKLLHFHEICLQEQLKVLEWEHIIGIMLDRGKETNNQQFWDIDYEFSLGIIEIFSKLLESIEHVDNDFNSISHLVRTYMDALNSFLNSVCAKIVNVGMPNQVKLLSMDKWLTDYIKGMNNV